MVEIVTLGMVPRRSFGAIAGKRAVVAGGYILTGIGSAILFPH